MHSEAGKCFLKKSLRGKYPICQGQTGPNGQTRQSSSQERDQNDEHSPSRSSGTRSASRTGFLEVREFVCLKDRHKIKRKLPDRPRWQSGFFRFRRKSLRSCGLMVYDASLSRKRRRVQFPPGAPKYVLVV